MSAFDFSLLTKGGPMMAVILLMALVLLVLVIERVLYLHRRQITSSKDFVDGIKKNTLEKRRIIEAITLCEETPGSVAAVVKAALVHANEDAENLRFAVQEAALVEIPVLERRLGSIAAIAQISPLVGLLGTLIGMVTTFHTFSLGGQYATGNALADGLWQALLATVGSLMVAIPAHLSYHFLSGRVRAVVRDIEWAANEIMQYLLTEYRGRGPTDIEASAPSAKKEAPTHDHAPA
jgi:biopolymer transport protein ExbB